MGERRGVTATHEWGVQATDGGARAMGAMNLDVYANEPEEGPVARAGVRMRSTFSEYRRDTASAVLARGAAFVGLGRELDTHSGGLGVEIAGGMSFDPIVEPIFEANLVFTGRWQTGR